MSESGTYCTDFHWSEDYEPDGQSTPLKCPSCGGWLSGTEMPYEEGKQWQCKKCSSVLEIIKDPPDPDEVEYFMDQFKEGIVYQLGLEPLPEYEEDEFNFSGKICVVPANLVTMQTANYAELRKNRPPKKHRTGIRVGGDAWFRSVWKDRNGVFILIDGERIEYESEKWKDTVKYTVPGGVKQ